MRFRQACGAAAVVACTLHVSLSRAEPPPQERARAAYDRGTAAFERKDFALAAREFAEADAIYPNPTALQAALDAANLADDPTIGAELLERSRRARVEGALADAIRAAEKRFAHRVGKIRVVCSATPCAAAVDGVAVDARAPVFARVGEHAVTIQNGAEARARVVTVVADQTVDARADLPAPASAPASATAPAPAPDNRPLAPAVFYAGAALTVIVGGLAIASGIDTASKHDDFVHCASDAACGSLAADGKAAQSRTNVLVGGAAVVGAATAVLAITLVRWGDTRVATGVANGAPSALLRGSF